MEASAPSSLLTVRVDAIRAEVPDIVSLRLVDPAGRPLPGCEPGAHIDLHLPNGLVRQYSLCETGPAPGHYRVAVARAPGGRGGSDFIHDRLAPGMELRIGRPRNLFPLEADGARYGFIAGGIGITPILPMLRWCAAERRPWRLLYCARSRALAAFLEEIAGIGGGRIDLHFDDECGGRFADLAALLDGVGEGEPVQCCGPAGLMGAVARLGQGRRRPVRFEWFAPAAPAVEEAGDRAFELRLARSGRSFTVPAGRSILEVLEEGGVDVVSGCRSGFCGVCQTPVCEGRVDHRDEVLSPADRAANRSLMICVSRACGTSLTLDL